MIDLKNKTLVLVVTYYFKETALMTLRALSESIGGADRFQVIVIDNNSRDGLQEELKRLNYPEFTIRLLEKNIGKANAINKITRELFDAGTIPEVMISMDGDITFSKDSLLLLNRAILSIPNAGMISMRYEDNGFSPEKNMPDQPTRYAGRDQTIFDIRTPQFINVAGGVFGISGECFKNILAGQLYPVPAGKVYCSDDRALFEKLRDAGCVNGYLDGTLATHHGGENYLFGDSPYARWKKKQLFTGGCAYGYFEKNQSNRIFQWLAGRVRTRFYELTGNLIELGLVPQWMQRKKRKRRESDSQRQ